ncbi:MAG: dihydroorotate dehydrogenase electron transfer subunit, partial [bacterium]
AQPGQFVNIRCSEDYDPLLRRPFGVHKTSKENKTFEVLFEVVGKGTELLSKHQVGQELDVLGPLGNGFQIDKNKKVAILVGGGMGIAPLLELGIREQRIGNRIIVLIGAKTKHKVLCEKEFKDLGTEVIVTTDDGSYGKKGFVSDVLLELLKSPKETTIYACGPKPMLQTVAKIAEQKNVSCQVSMEARMACGIGTCLGCVIQTKNGYKKVCDDGPVFEAKEILWQS